MLSLVESGSEYSQNYALENPVLEPGASIANLNLAVSPTTEIVTGVSRQSSTQGSMTYHLTARLSYSLSGSYFITGRTQGVGMWGHQASGDVNYRLTAKATVGAYYSYTNYDYSHGVASSDSHAGGGIFSYAFSRRMQLQTRLGATRIESLAYSAVPLPPELAAILGEPSIIVNAYSLHWTSVISAQLVKDLGQKQDGDGRLCARRIAGERHPADICAAEHQRRVFDEPAEEDVFRSARASPAPSSIPHRSARSQFEHDGNVLLFHKPPALARRIEHAPLRPHPLHRQRHDGGSAAIIGSPSGSPGASRRAIMRKDSEGLRHPEKNRSANCFPAKMQKYREGCAPCNARRPKASRGWISIRSTLSWKSSG